MNKKIAKDLLFKTDWLMDEYFFKKMGYENYVGVRNTYVIEDQLIIIRNNNYLKKLK